MYRVALLLFCFLTNLIQAEEQICNQDLLDRSFVTQCGPNICEPLFEILTSARNETKVGDWPSSKNEVIHIVSTREGERFKVNTYRSIDTTEFYYEDSHVNGTIFVDTHTKYQKVLGFGTTLTDSSCKNVDDLSEDIRDNLIKDYFSTEDGIGLNLIKVPIGSTKYSFTNYVLDQPDKDQVELSSYDTDRLAIIRDAKKAAGRLRSRVKIIASSSTAPSEFKQNNQLSNGGLVRPDRIKDYASYLVNSIGAYQAQGVDIWSLILGDSPVEHLKECDANGANKTLEYSSMAMRPSDMIELIRSINEIRSENTNLDKFRMLLLGDNRAHIPVWSDAIFGVSNVGNSVAGVAYTCDLDKTSSYDNLIYTNNRYPKKYLVAVQGSINTPVKLGNWQYGENYGTEIIKNFQYGAVGWIDFNMALNLNGGPSLHNKFNSDASIIINTEDGTYYRTPMFYAIGHLSRYVKPGSIRVKVQHFYGAFMFANQYIAFQTPDNYLVVFVMNNNINPMPISIGIDTRTKVESLLETKSFNTFIFRL